MPSAAAEPVGINDVGSAMSSALYHGRPWFDSVAGISSSDCTEDEAESLRPAVVRFWAQEAKREVLAAHGATMARFGYSC